MLLFIKIVYTKTTQLTTSDMKRQRTELQTPGNAAPSEPQRRADGLLTINNLNYALEPDLSVAVNRTHKNHYAQSNEYTNTQRAIFILNSGADTIDTLRSYLALDLEVILDFDPLYAGTDNEKQVFKNTFFASFGSNGSVLNLISDLTISSRSGDELVRINDFAQLQNMLIPAMYSREWITQNGPMFGFGADVIPNENNTAGVGDMKNKFIIPMYLLSPFFGYGRLMPAMLMSGLRIEIGWHTPEKAMILHALNGLQTIASPGAASNSGQDTYPRPSSTDTSKAGYQTKFNRFVIKNPYFSLCSVQLSDSIQRALNEQSAVNGLEIVYCDFERDMIALPGLATSVHQEVRKSCSRATKAFSRVTLDDSDRQSSRMDSFAGEMGLPFTEYQWQLGSLYFPQQPVKSSSVDRPLDIGREAYFHFLDSVDRLAPTNRSQAAVALTFDTIVGHNIYDPLTYYQYRTSQTIMGLYGKNLALPAKESTFMHNGHVIGVNLERTSLFNLAGVPVNNSRVLALHAKMQGSTYQKFDDNNTSSDVSDNARRVLFTYLKYVKLARVFLNNVEVEQ